MQKEQVKQGDVGQSKIESLQALRTIAFLGIFTSHCDLTQLGSWGVSVFFILSGFVMYYTYKDREMANSISDVVKFAIQKIKKLYLLHIFMMLAAMVFVGHELLKNFSLYNFLGVLTKTVLNVLLLQAWLPSAETYFSFNGVAWYLSVCLFLYIVFPVILGITKRYKTNKNAVINIVVLYIVQIIVAIAANAIGNSYMISEDFIEWITYIAPFYRLGDFAIGCNLGYIFVMWKNNSENINPKYISVLEIAVVFLIVVSQIIHREQISLLGSEWCRHTLLFIPSSIILVFIFALNKGIITKLATNKVFVFIGNISAYAFLIHQIVIRYFDKVLSFITTTQVNIGIKTVACFIMTVVASLVWKYIEDNIIQRKKETLSDHN